MTVQAFIYAYKILKMRKSKKKDLKWKRKNI